MDKEAVKHWLAGITLPELLDIQTYVDDLVAERSPDVVAGQAYDQMRFEFAKIFPDYQLDTFKLWRHLKPVRQREFSKAWNKAIKYFSKFGCKNSSALHAVIVEMVVKSPYFVGKILFADLLQSLEQIEILFDHNFPGYRDDPAAIELLVSKLQ